MKKIFTLCAIAILAVASISAADVDFSVGLGFQNTDMALTVKDEDSTMNTKLDAKIDAFAFMTFKKGHGMKVRFAPDFSESSFTVLAAYAYRMKLSERNMLMLSAGLSLDCKNSDTIMGTDVMADFLFNISGKLNAVVGVGAEIDFVEFADDGTDGIFVMRVPMPYIGASLSF